MTTHSSVRASIIPQRAWQDTVHGVAKSQTQLSMHNYSSPSSILSLSFYSFLYAFSYINFIFFFSK